MVNVASLRIPHQPMQIPKGVTLHDDKQPVRHQPLLRHAYGVVFALLIINKAGGLIYNRNFNPGLANLTVNDYLNLAGTFSSVHAISRQICPPALKPTNPPAALIGNSPALRAAPTGIEVLETDKFRLQCFQTVTGVKFLLFTEVQQPNVDNIVRRVYELYSDFVMKNPFYTVEMPIRSEKFDKGLEAYIRVPRS